MNNNYAIRLLENELVILEISLGQSSNNQSKEKTKSNIETIKKSIEILNKENKNDE